MSGSTKKTVFTIVIVTVLLIVLILLSADPNSKLHSVYKVVSFPVMYIQAAFSSIGDDVSDRYSVFTEYEAIKDKITALEEENDRLSSVEKENESLRQENEELRDMLDMKGSFEGYSMVAADIIATDVTDWFNEFTVNVGSADGIKEGYVVITTKGLAGIVYNVGVNSSKIRTVVDEQNTIMARINRNNELVRLKGMTNENYVPLLKLDRIATSTDMYVGDVIVTAESGGVYPKGIIIGTVVQISTQAETETRYAYVEPGVDFSRLSKVYVLIPEGEEAQ